jgi:hypothetical protein
MLPRRRHLELRDGSLGPVWLGLLFLFALAESACSPRIGDDCRSNQECSGETQRLCDTSQRGGYCTVLNCSPTSCPSGESVCVLFNSAISPLPACQSAPRPSPYGRSLCMRFCDVDADCRDGYECIDVSGFDPWAAEIVSNSTAHTKICIVPPLSGTIPDDRATGVCTGPTPSEPTPEGGAGGQSAGSEP